MELFNELKEEIKNNSNYNVSYKKRLLDQLSKAEYIYANRSIFKYIEVTDRYTSLPIKIAIDEIVSIRSCIDGKDYREITLKNGKEFHVLDTLSLINNKINPITRTVNSM